MMASERQREDVVSLSMIPTWDTAAPSFVRQEKKLNKQTNTETREGGSGQQVHTLRHRLQRCLVVRPHSCTPYARYF